MVAAPKETTGVARRDIVMKANPGITQCRAKQSLAIMVVTSKKTKTTSVLRAAFFALFITVPFRSIGCCRSLCRLAVAS